MPFSPAPPLPDFLARDLPSERFAYTLENGLDAGRSLHFLDTGPRDARPVLLLHGNPTWSYLWRHVIAALPEFRTIAPDLLGLGFSSRLPRLGDHTVERHGAAISELALALDLRDLLLVGQDWGGPIVAQVGLTLGERATALLLANTAVVFKDPPHGSRFHRFARLPIVSDLAFRGFGFPQNRLWSVQGDRNSIRGETARAYTWPLRSWRDRVAPLALARMVPNDEHHPSLPALRRGADWARTFSGPKALIWGERDPILGRALARHERELNPAFTVRTEAGHFLQEEVPREVAEAIRRLASLTTK